MSKDQMIYAVIRPEETRARGSAASSYIPTFGAATTAIDQYRIVGILESNLEEFSVAFTDVSSVAALSKIAEGGISNHREIEAAEVALQALLLHDCVHVVVPSPKIQLENGLITYIRLDKGMRTNFGFELFQLTNSKDWIIAAEFIREQGGRIVESTFRESPLLNKKLEDIRNEDNRIPYLTPRMADAINSTIQEHGVPLYLSNDDLTRPRRGDGFSKQFYHRMRISWNDAVGDLPPIVCTFNLPPLLAIVLDRLNNRADLKSVIKDLREEIKGARKELFELNSLVTSSITQAEIESRVNHIYQSFDAIIPESRLSGPQRFKRRIFTIQKLVRPIIKFMAAFATDSGLLLEDILNIPGNIDQIIYESNAIIDRTVTAKTFSGLVKTESIQSLVQHHFTPAEISAIEKSLSSSNR